MDALAARAEARRREWRGGVARSFGEMATRTLDFWLAMTPVKRLKMVAAVPFFNLRATPLMTHSERSLLFTECRIRMNNCGGILMNRKRHFSKTALATTLLAMGALWCSVASADTLVLKDGTILVGEIVEQGGIFFHFRPIGQQTTTLVSRSDVIEVRQSGGNAGEPYLNQPPEPTPEERARAYAISQRAWQDAKDAELARLEREPVKFVRVHLEGSGEAELHRESGLLGSRVVCRSPCGVTIEVRPSDTFEISGSGVTSHEVSVPLDVSSVRYRVDAGSSAARVGGIVGLSVGGAAALAGAMLLSRNDFDDRNQQGERITGGTLIGAGVLGASVSLVLVLTLGTTDVELLKTDAGAVAPLSLDLTGGAPVLRF